MRDLVDELAEDLHRDGGGAAHPVHRHHPLLVGVAEERRVALDQIAQLGPDLAGEEEWMLQERRRETKRTKARETKAGGEGRPEGQVLVRVPWRRLRVVGAVLRVEAEEHDD